MTNRSSLPQGRRFWGNITVFVSQMSRKLVKILLPLNTVQHPRTTNDLKGQIHIVYVACVSHVSIHAKTHPWEMLTFDLQ